LQAQREWLFTKSDRHGGKANELMNLYAEWFGNEELMTEDWKNRPREKRIEAMRKALETAAASTGMTDRTIPKSFWSCIERGEVPAQIAPQR